MKRFTIVCQKTVAPIILIFTKRDLFVKNLNGYAIPKHLPHISESTDPKTFMADTFQFFGTTFRSLDHRVEGGIYVYWINAIDTGEVASIFQEMRENICERQQFDKVCSISEQPRRWNHDFEARSAWRYEDGAHIEYMSRSAGAWSLNPTSNTR